MPDTQRFKERLSVDGLSGHIVCVGENCKRGQTAVKFQSGKIDRAPNKSIIHTRVSCVCDVRSSALTHRPEPSMTQTT